jgi:hypothetical protein
MQAEPVCQRVLNKLTQKPLEKPPEVPGSIGRKFFKLIRNEFKHISTFCTMQGKDALYSGGLPNRSYLLDILSVKENPTLQGRLRNSFGERFWFRSFRTYRSTCGKTSVRTYMQHIKLSTHKHLKTIDIRSINWAISQGKKSYSISDWVKEKACKNGQELSVELSLLLSFTSTLWLELNEEECGFLIELLDENEDIRDLAYKIAIWATNARLSTIQTAL